MQPTYSADENSGAGAQITHRHDFGQSLRQHDLALVKTRITTLQINVGLYCNQVCRHCHLDAGPRRREIMSAETIDQVRGFAAACRFPTIDLTGGAPELHPRIDVIIRSLKPLCEEMILRSNLTALAIRGKPLMERLKSNGIKIVASLPSLNAVQLQSVRGENTFQKSIQMLKKLNALGYGRPDSGLELDLVVNPAGAFLPSSQQSIEKRYHQVLEDRWGVAFNRLFSLANVPLGRFRDWLARSGNLESYLQKLAAAFNPCTVAGLMCRSLVSVSWDGFLFDCDFNQSIRLHQGNRKCHISRLNRPPRPGTVIAFDQHCYTCTAGSGFT